MKLKHFTRILNTSSALERKSCFLLGARSTGKTTLYHDVLKPSRVYDLLDRKVYRSLQLNPSLIFEEATEKKELVVIDEIQKIPGLLDEVQRTIEAKGTRFLLTGSSARKLKRNQSNLLGGRATQLELLPLTTREIPDFNLERYLNHGGIPRHYLSPPEHIEDELDDYVSLYLKEEVADEALVRNIEGFSRLLEVMALHSGDELAYEAFASDTGIKVGAFKNHLEILKDTLIGFEVESFLKTKKRKAITRSKFFLFDVGVTRYLSKSGPLKPKNPLFGKAFEHFIAQEIRAYLNYKKIRIPLCYWRSTSQMEVDFIVGEKLALEVKATDTVTHRHLKGLLAFGEEKLPHHKVLVSMEARARKLEGVEVLPWKVFLDRLWEGDFT